jgi:uncharacterized protein (TIGR02246 family)
VPGTAALKIGDDLLNNNNARGSNGRRAAAMLMSSIPMGRQTFPCLPTDSSTINLSWARVAGLHCGRSPLMFTGRSPHAAAVEAPMRLSLLVFVGALALGGSPGAQTSPSPAGTTPWRPTARPAPSPVPQGVAAPSAADAVAIAEVLAFEKAMEAAVVSGDTAFLDRALAPTFVFTHGDGWVDGGAPLKVDSKASWIEYVKRQPPPYWYRDLDHVQVELHGDIALTLGRYFYSPRQTSSTEDSASHMHVWFERLYAKRSGRWQHLSHRTVKGPQPTPRGDRSSDNSASDDASVRAVVASYVDARERQDQAAIGALFTADADQFNTAGEWRRGREAIVRGTQASSQRNSGTRRISLRAVRFPAAGVAIADGDYQIAAAAGAARSMWTTFVLIRQAEGWRIAAIRNALPTGPVTQ